MSTWSKHELRKIGEADDLLAVDRIGHPRWVRPRIGHSIIHHIQARCVEIPEERDLNRRGFSRENEDPIADVLISGLRAAAALRDQTLKPSVASLSRQDRSMKVRQAAMEALREM